MSTRTLLRSASVVWAVVGAGIAALGLPSVNSDSRLIVSVAGVVGPVCALLASFLLGRRQDRGAGLCLLVSVATPTFFAAVVNIPALIVGAALVVAPRAMLPRPRVQMG